MPKVLLKFKDSVLKVVDMNKARLTIGRNAGNDIRIDNPAVSAFHARIEKSQGRFRIEDLDSTNGTFVHDSRVSQQILNDNDIVTIGKHTLVFLLEGGDVTDAVTDGPAPARPDLDKTMILDTKAQRERLARAAQREPAGAEAPATREGPVGVLTVLKGGAGQRELVLTDRLTLIGKDKQAGIRLTGLLAPRIGGYIGRDQNGYTLIPPDHRVRIKVNDRPVEKGVPLNDGDRIEIGNVGLRFQVKPRK